MTSRSSRSAAPPIALCAALLLAFATVSSAQSVRPRVAVLDFDNTSSWTHWGPQLGRAAAEQMTGELVRSGQYSVIERSQLGAVLDEQALGQSGTVDAETAGRLGELLGVQVLVTGAVTQFSIETKRVGLGPASVNITEAESVIDARLIDTNTGEIIAVAEGSGKKRIGGASIEDVDYEQRFDEGVALEALRPAVEGTVAGLSESRDVLVRLALSAVRPGNVVGVAETSIYIDRGNADAIQEGQHFVVERIVDEIRDMDGKLLDTVTEPVGLLRVTRVLDNSSVCELLDGEALEGDTVTPQA